MAMTYEQEAEWRKHFKSKRLAFVVHALNQLDSATWTAEPEKESSWILTKLTSDAGEQFSIGHNRDGGEQGKLTIYSNYGQHRGRVWIPRDALRHYDTLSDPQPSMSGSKEPEQIAKDIVRRFLPDYRACRAIYLKAVADSAAYDARLQAFVDEIRKESGGAILFTSHYNRDQHSTEKTGEINSALVSYGQIRVTDDSARLELSVNREGALLFARMLAAAGPRKTNQD